jgi:GTPase SAR1 family protein
MEWDCNAGELMAARRKYPNEFRREEVTQIIQSWDAGEAISLVGIGSVGKTNLIQHLTDAQVRRAYLDDSVNQLYVVVIDANMLGPLPSPTVAESDQIRCWAGFELMMHRLFLAFYPFPQLSPEESKRFYDTYQMLQDGTNPLYAYMSIRYFELGLEYLMRKDLKIVFIFDEFEEMLKQMPPKFFQLLRGLRDIYKGKLIYTTFSRSPLPTLVERYKLPLLETESFIELFNDNVIYIGPYNETDARQMVQSLAQRKKTQHPDLANALLLEATGRYAGLLRAGFNLLDDMNTLNWSAQTTETFAELLATRQPIRIECQSIWMGLNRSEQYVLKAVVRLQTYAVSEETEYAVNMLVQKRLLRTGKGESRLIIDPPVFRAYIRSNPEAT